jgi:hypothetical protein
MIGVLFAFGVMRMNRGTGNASRRSSFFGARVYRQSDMDNYGNPKRHAFPFSSLGMVGVNSMSDVYLLNCEADLMREALIELDSEDAEKAQVMSERATYAGTV